ncbi:MAG: translocation/assembly module TamB domain-containing protein [Chitinophagaceae bacterium]|nr:translocation/assembly module TamB domain-containing protein [Chitinophagaceae bacterium]
MYTLIFWLVLAVLFIYVLPAYTWLFVVLLLGWALAWGILFKKTKQKLAFFAFLVILLFSTWGLLQLNPVQNWVLSKVTATLSKNLKTKVTLGHVNFGLFNKLSFEKLLVEDKKHDTLLYAGAAKVNITDWFFLKDNATLTYFGLTDAVVNINRTDSVWNYQFLVDYFSGPKKTKPSKGGIEFDLQVLHLENVVFSKADKWIGQDMKVAIQKLDLKADVINFNRKQIYIADLILDAPVFTQSVYKGNKPKIENNNLRDLVPKMPVLSALQWNTDGWEIKVANIEINNASFKYDIETPRGIYTDQFDGQHLQFTGITGSLKNVSFINDTLTTELKLKTRERSGLEVLNLQSKVKFTPDIMEFKDLLLETSKSRISNYYSMRYKDFEDDLSSFIHNVQLEGRFKASTVHSDDIAVFAPRLKTWNRKFYIDGNVKGTIDNLSAKKIIIKTANTIVDGDISLKGLPDINSTFIDFRSNNLQTNYTDLVTLVPSLRSIRQPRLTELGNIRFKGNFTGFINDFVAYGMINTNLGNLNADINMKLPANKVPTYSGKLSSAGFNLGRFFNNQKLGQVSFEGKVKGSGFNVKTLNADFDGKIHYLEFSGYPYQQITVNGTFVKSLFTGHLEINDPNLVINNLDGSISLLEDTTKFNFIADLQKANLQKLKFTEGDYSLSGLLSLNFKGNTIDDFIGTAKLYDATLRHDTTRLSFDFLTLQSLMEGIDKTLTVQSNEIEGKLTGQYNILQLPEAFRVFLNRYYPSYFKKPAYTLGDQDFSFNISTREVDSYVKLFDKRLSGFNHSVFSGNLKLAKNEFNLNAQVPEFSFDGKKFTNTQVNAIGNKDSLNTVVSVSDVFITDSLHFPNSKLILSSSNDISNISLSTSASQTISDAQLNARIQTFTDGVKIHLFPSSFILNDKKWNLARDGEITLRKSYIEASDVKFTQGNQEIVISTELDELTDHTNLVAKLKTVNINDFTQLFLKNPRLEGVLTGTLKLRDPFGKQIIEFDGYADDFRFDNKDIGKVNIKGNVNTSTGLVTAKADADGKLYKFNVDGKFNYKDSVNNQMNFALQAERFDIGILDNYLGGIFSNMKGNVNTKDLKVYAGPDHNYITGTVNVTEGELKVKYTQVVYRFTNETIIFNPDEIDFGLLQLRDTLNNTGTASGKIQHRFFNKFGFDNIRFETGKMLLLNTTKRDNNQFYGKVIGKALMTLNGPVTDMRMNITGEPSAVDSSHIFIPTSNSQETGKIDYIDFIQYGSKMEDEYIGRQESNFLVNMNITANPACKIDLILDELTGDIIKGRGNGLLKITVGTKEPLSIRGRYEITDGEYKFNFQTFIQKYFSITDGSSITWNGDPYEAQINIDAEYLAPNVDLSSLATSRGRYQQKSDLLIVAHLTNTLKAPKISFEFEIPQNKQTDYSKDPVLLENLKKFAKDENEQNRQVASLLLFNTFINDNNGGFGASTASFLSGTAGQVISGFLNNQLTKVFQKLFNDPTITPYISFNSSYNLTSSELINALEASGNFGFKKSYINGRLVVSLGGNIDYNNPYILQARNTNVLLTPDITVEYLLTKDGKLRIVGFNRTVVDATLGQRNRTGLRLSYTRDFDKLTKAERIAQREERRKNRDKKNS